MLVGAETERRRAQWLVVSLAFNGGNINVPLFLVSESADLPRISDIQLPLQSVPLRNHILTQIYTPLLQHLSFWASHIYRNHIKNSADGDGDGDRAEGRGNVGCSQVMQPARQGGCPVLLEDQSSSERCRQTWPDYCQVWQKPSVCTVQYVAVNTQMGPVGFLIWEIWSRALRK